MTKIKIKCVVIFFNLLGNVRKRSPETMVQVSDKGEGHLKD